jgi:hypothetical protein
MRERVGPFFFRIQISNTHTHTHRHTRFDRGGVTQHDQTMIKIGPPVYYIYIILARLYLHFEKKDII